MLKLSDTPLKGYKKVIYTVNLGDYDEVKPIESEFDCLLITDNPEAKVKGWETVFVEPKEDILKQSRELKINIHKFVNAELYIYIDANYELLRDINPYLDRHFKGGLTVSQHPARDCIYYEARKVLELKKESFNVVDKQMRQYQREGLKMHYGLFEGGFVIRDNSVNKFCEKWFNEVEKHSYRDQLSLPYAIWKYKPTIKAVMPHYKRDFLKLHTRKPKPVEAPTPRVWYFTPGRGDKNLGQSYNDHCEAVPEGDWICIRDGDTMFLNPYWPKQIEDIIKKHGKDYPLISCVTNRLGLEWQLPNGFSEDPNVLNHAKIADELYENEYDTVEKSPRPTAGLFMLFPKRTWNRIKFAQGLTGKGKFIDWQFSEAVQRKFGKIGIAKGLYLFHFYRFNRKSKRDIEHLI